MKKCMGCMKDYSESYAECPACGYSDAQIEIDMENMPNILRPETILGGRYILGRTLSNAQYSTTYLAWDALLLKRVVIKEYCPEELGHRMEDNSFQCSSDKKQDIFARGMKEFINEAKILNRNQDIPEIIQIYRVIRKNNTAYMVMEYIEGCTLRDWIDGDSDIAGLSADAIFSRLSEAVEHIHARGIIHYNLSPDNVYVDGDGRLRLINFGSAKRQLHLLMKNSGDGLFDKRYTAPEILKNNDADQRADYYSLGTILYTLSTGDLPKYSTKRRSSLKLADKLVEKQVNTLSAPSPNNRPVSLEVLRMDAGSANSGRKKRG